MCFLLTVQNGVTAVDVARLRGHTDVVDILMKSRAETNPMVSNDRNSFFAMVQ